MFLTQEHFQGKHKYRRWISGLHSVQDDRGKVVMKVGECSHPIDPPASPTLLYSWRLLGPTRERQSSVPKGLRGPPSNRSNSCTMGRSMRGIRFPVTGCSIARLPEAGIPATDRVYRNMTALDDGGLRL